MAQNQWTKGSSSEQAWVEHDDDKTWAHKQENTGSSPEPANSYKGPKFPKFPSGTMHTALFTKVSKKMGQYLKYDTENQEASYTQACLGSGLDPSGAWAAIRTSKRRDGSPRFELFGGEDSTCWVRLVGR